jgi:signal transduction histidine kinase
MRQAYHTRPDDWYSVGTSLSGTAIFVTGPLWLAYAMAILGAVAAGLLSLIIHRTHAAAAGDLISVRQISLILGGFAVSIGVALFVFLFLETFWTVPAGVVDLALSSMVILVLCTGYAVARYDLFTVKAVIAHFLLLVLLSLNMAYLVTRNAGDSFPPRVAGDAAMFLLLLAVTIGLLRSIDAEVRERERAEGLLRKLEDFLSFATHELRSPITTFKGALSMLIDGSFGSIRAKALGIIKRLFVEADRMGQTVDTFLDVNKIVAGEFNLAPAEHDIVLLIQSCMTQVELQAAEKNLYLAASLPDHPVMATFDFFMLQHVPHNILVIECNNYNLKNG